VSLTVEIVTPSEIVFSGAVDQIQAPGVMGEFGVLEQHAKLLGTTRPGLVTIDSSGEAVRLVVGAGFAEVGAEGLTLLVDSCEEAGSYDKEQATADLAEAEQLLATVDPMSNEFERARNRVDLATARISA